jgi:hypothetical protein
MKTLFSLTRQTLAALCRLGFILLFPTLVFGQQNYLEVPVRLEVEKGDMSEVVVKVKKDGKDAFTQSGASKMRFKLDYNMKYTLVFTKPGYITKTIEFNTKAPSARISQGFEPYRIGVKLFLQNDENQVIYNQPVAQIRYDSNLDEFNFETDYSKSILSAISTGDEENKQQEPAPAAPKELDPTAGQDNKTNAAANQQAGGADPATARAGNGSGSDPAPNTTTTVPPPPPPPAPAPPPPAPVAEEKKATPVTPVQQEEPKPAAAIAGDEPPAAKANAGGESPKAPLPTNAGEEKGKGLAAAQGEEQKRSMRAGSGEESKRGGKGAAGDERPRPAARPSAGNEKPAVTVNQSAGAELPGEGSGMSESEKITREDIVEPNRIITKIKVIRNGIETEYTRVNHRWGGVFYFRNNKQSIPENLFVQWTGVRP